MILGFSTIFPKGKGKLSGNKTHFVEKIWQSISESITMKTFTSFLDGMENVNYDFSLDAIDMMPKLHTIRSDEKNRWIVGMDIHFYIGVRTKNMFRFAPTLKVKSIQKIEITYDEDICEKYFSIPTAFIDNRPLTILEFQQLAVNDGFADESEFCHWFDEDFTGKIIHWTDLKY